MKIRDGPNCQSCSRSAIKIDAQTTSRREMIIEHLLRTPTRALSLGIVTSAMILSTADPCDADDSGASNTQPKKLQFTTLPDGVRWADVRTTADNPRMASDKVVTPNSKVNFHMTGRLLGKNGWIFENSQLDDNEPYRLQLGNGSVVVGLEEGMQGMKEGDTRRIVIPSTVGYTNKSLEPIPRDFGNRQRLYTTVMNNVRIDRERAALGNDLAGMVVMDIEVLRIRSN
eukprot:CAMPEP_0198114876 /NCGR_PEP_ID=MMETSP1442-20131203/6123_1 /TAXON_ID= /ORGANISM="Craspedostauros australis, Strain CCMP3328" /LENGTH=227 /DNA_ID=CAMNT_0043772277 /DNA_START=225 /DNA_END=908 /DNA_ORIENTATION=-